MTSEAPAAAGIHAKLGGRLGRDAAWLTADVAAPFPAAATTTAGATTTSATAIGVRDADSTSRSPACDDWVPVEVETSTLTGDSSGSSTDPSIFVDEPLFDGAGASSLLGGGRGEDDGAGDGTQ